MTTSVQIKLATVGDAYELWNPKTAPNAHSGPWIFWGEIVLFLVLHCPLWEIWVTATTRAALPIPISVCSIFMSKQCIWDFQRALRCWSTWLHTQAVWTPYESALETDSGRKMPCRTRDLNPHQYCAWLFSRMLYQLSYWWNSIYWWKSLTSALQTWWNCHDDVLDDSSTPACFQPGSV